MIHAFESFQRVGGYASFGCDVLKSWVVVGTGSFQMITDEQFIGQDSDLHMVMILILRFYKFYRS